MSAFAVFVVVLFGLNGNFLMDVAFLWALILIVSFFSNLENALDLENA